VPVPVVASPALPARIEAIVPPLSLVVIVGA
jgi:hypothetical protein